MLTTHLARMNGRCYCSWRRIVKGNTLSGRYNCTSRAKENNVWCWLNTSLSSFQPFCSLCSQLSSNDNKMYVGAVAVVDCKRSVADYAKTSEFACTNESSSENEQHVNDVNSELPSSQKITSLMDSKMNKEEEQMSNTQKCERADDHAENDSNRVSAFNDENIDNNSSADESINDEELIVIVNEVVELLKRNGPLPISRLSSQLSEEILEQVSYFKGGLLEVCSMYDETFIIQTLAGGIRVVMLRNIIDRIGAAELQRNFYNRNNYSSIMYKAKNNQRNTNERQDDLEIADVTDADRALLTRVVALFTAAMYFPRKVPNGLPSSNPYMEEIYNSLRATIIDETESSKSDTSSTVANTSFLSSTSSSLTLRTLGPLKLVADKLNACPSFFDINNSRNRVRFHRRLTITPSQSELISRKKKSKTIVLNYLQAKQNVLSRETGREENKKQPQLKFEDGKLVTVSFMKSKANGTESNKTMENRLTRVLREIVPRTFFVPLTHLMSDKRAYLYFDVKDKLEIVANELKIYGKNVVDLRSFNCKVQKASELSTYSSREINEKKQSTTSILPDCTSESPLPTTTTSSASLSASSEEESRTCENKKSMLETKLSKQGEREDVEHAKKECMDEVKKGEEVENVVFVRLIDSSISNNMLATDYGDLEVNCLEYNIFALGSRIIQEFTDKITQEPQVKLRCIKGITMNELHDILSPSLLNDMTKFFTSCILTSRRRYEQQLQLQRRQVEQERLHEQAQQVKPEQEIQQREKREDVAPDSKDCNTVNTQRELEIDQTVFILIFDRLRHYFDVNFSINSVRPWSVLTEDLQPSSLTTETTTLPLVLRALRVSLSVEPLTLEQLYHNISNFCKIQLLALYDNPEWIKWNAHDKNQSEIENELRKVSTERAVNAMKLFVSCHSLYVRHDTNDNLVYTPLLTAAALQQKFINRKKEEYDEINKENRACIFNTNEHDEVDDEKTYVGTTHSEDAAGVDMNETNKNTRGANVESDVINTSTKLSNNASDSNDKCNNSATPDHSFNGNNINNDNAVIKKSNITSSTKQSTQTTSSANANPQRNQRQPYDRYSSNTSAVKGTAMESAEILMNVLPRNQALLRNCVNGLIKGTPLKLNYIQKRETYTRYPALFRTYQPFASHLELVSRADIPPPPEDTLQPKRCTVEMLVKYMALQTIHGGVDGNIMNIISEEGRLLMKSIGNFADIAQQLPMWFEVRRDTHSSNGSMITYIGGASDKIGNRDKGMSDDMVCNEFCSEDACDSNSMGDDERKEESVEEVRRRLGMRRIVNGTLEPVDEFDDDKHFLGNGKWDPEWGEEDEIREERYRVIN